MTATTTGTYATLTNLKLRLGITDTTDDALLQLQCDWANQGIESYTSRIFASSTGTYLYNGTGTGENGRYLPIDTGVQSISLLRCAFYTGGSFLTIPATDYFILPAIQDRASGWPGTELWMTDVPSSGNPSPVFSYGIANIEVTGTFGWAHAPDDIINVALNVAVAEWRGRSSQGGDTFTAGIDGERTFTRYLSSEDMHTLNRYKVRRIGVI